MVRGGATAKSQARNLLLVRSLKTPSRTAPVLMKDVVIANSGKIRAIMARSLPKLFTNTFVPTSATSDPATPRTDMENRAYTANTMENENRIAIIVLFIFLIP